MDLGLIGRRVLTSGTSLLVDCGLTHGVQF